MEQRERERERERAPLVKDKNTYPITLQVLSTSAKAKLLPPTAAVVQSKTNLEAAAAHASLFSRQTSSSPSQTPFFLYSTR